MIKVLFQKILVVYDGSLSSLHAVQYGIMMAKLYKCQVKVVFVVDDASIKKLLLSKFIVSEEASSMKDHLLSDSKRDMEYIKALAKKKNVNIEVQTLEGAVWSEVIRAANDFKANLILVGEDSANPYQENHLNVSREIGEIVGSANCSVLVVKEPFVEQLFKLC